MELKHLCKTMGIEREDIWNTATHIASCAYIEGSKVSASVVYSALAGSKVISLEDRMAIMTGIDHAKRYSGWERVHVTMRMIDWKEAPDTRTWTQKYADWQEQQNHNFTNELSGHTKTRDALNREERARRAYIACGGQ